MAATVTINRYTGAGPTSTVIPANTVVTLNDSPQMQSDAGQAGVLNPIPIPAAGVNRSFWCTTGLEVTVAPTTAINNVRWYTDGSNGFGTGVTCDVPLSPNETIVRASYDQATGTTITGDALTTHAAVTAVQSAFVHQLAGSNELVVGNGSIGNTTGALGDFVVYQFVVAAGAAPGPTNQEQFTWAFDET